MKTNISTPAERILANHKGDLDKAIATVKGLLEDLKSATPCNEGLDKAYGNIILATEDVLNDLDRRKK